MNWLEAIILGLVQGFTEFLPISSSGHLVIGKEILGIETSNLHFEVIVHAATVMSTLVVFRKDIANLIKGLFKFRYNSETEYILKIAISMIPIFILGIFFKKNIEAIFGSGLMVVGFSLLITALLLTLTTIIKPAERELTYGRSFLIGIAQSIAVLPGLSRSGATISTGMLLGIDKSEVARFSFLMVLVPIMGEAFLELVSGELSEISSNIPALSLVAGFLAAFLSGLVACKVMIALVKRAKLVPFAVYCAILGGICLLYTVL